MIHRAKGFTRLAHAAIHGSQPVKGLRCGDFMNQMAVDVQQRRLVFSLKHHVCIE